jgi:hypothetical protein
MSETEEVKEQTVAEGEQKEQGKEHVEAGHEPVKPGTWRFLIPLAAFLVGFVSLFFAGWVIFPLVLYAEKEQPIDFNHKLHMEELGECDSCHFFREDGSFAGVPKLANCTQCHEEAVGTNPEEAKLVHDYVEPGKEIPWLIYSRQPQCVFFSHAAHVKGAEMSCTTCHGPIGESDHMKPYQYNRLTKYSRDIWGMSIAGFEKHTWSSMKMDDCADCHKKMTGHKGTCFQCHK